MYRNLVDLPRTLKFNSVVNGVARVCIKMDIKHNNKEQANQSTCHRESTHISKAKKTFPSFTGSNIQNESVQANSPIQCTLVSERVGKIEDEKVDDYVPHNPCDGTYMEESPMVSTYCQAIHTSEVVNNKKIDLNTFCNILGTYNCTNIKIQSSNLDKLPLAHMNVYDGSIVVFGRKIAQPMIPYQLGDSALVNDKTSHSQHENFIYFNESRH
jgi:hypothetical protein